MNMSLIKEVIMKIDKFEVNESNCNAVLNHLYNERNKISNSIDKLISLGYSTIHAEEEYDKLCKIIEDVCAYRRFHDCALEGDKNYSYNIYGG